MCLSRARIIAFINNSNRLLGKASAWLALAMVLLMAFNVLERYAFDRTVVWQQELVRFFHAILFLGAAAFTLQDDGHVRVDVFYQHFSPRRKALIECFGIVCFLLPFCIALSLFASDFILESWRLREASAEYNGMPGIFILKSFVWVFTVSLGLQGVSGLLTSLPTALGREDI